MLSWLKSKLRKHPRHPEKLVVPELRFTGEQDGPVEQELKGRLIQFFNRDKSVQRAYLAKAVYENNSVQAVALCLKTQFGNDPGLAEKIGRIFATIFNRDQFMDLIFLSAAQEEKLRTVCQPFFVKNEK